MHMCVEYDRKVSTHSRLKAAGKFHLYNIPNYMFQHTAA